MASGAPKQSLLQTLLGGYAGDGFLIRLGYTVIWSGWQGDLIDRGENVVARLPFALRDGQPLRGRVRQEFNPMTYTGR